MSPKSLVLLSGLVRLTRQPVLLPARLAKSVALLFNPKVNGWPAHISEG
jgi:hypothetical protein